MGQEEEFAEVDVLWPEPDHPGDVDEKQARPFACKKPVTHPVRTSREARDADFTGAGDYDGDENPARPFARRKSVSPPVRIPGLRAAPPCHRRRARRVELEGDDVSCGNGESMECGVPPHVMVRRRAAAFAGREKGLRLCDFRDAVLRLTGFIEG